MESGSVNSKSEGLLSRMALNDNKAGMEGLDRDKINKIIMESSKVNTNLYQDIWVPIWPSYHDVILNITRVCNSLFCSLLYVQGSRFYENELKREQQVNRRIERMMQQKAQITEQQLKKAQAQVRVFSSIWDFLELVLTAIIPVCSNLLL